MKNLFILVAMLNVSSINIIAEEALLFNLKDNKILPANEAFKLETSIVPDELQIKWIIKDGYYLYFDSILVEANKELIEYKVLDSKVLDHEDIFFGKTKILKDMLVISVKNFKRSILEVSYQGCSEQGFCYPIQKVNIS
tara:strand:- start:8162 stop:8578 length:417 start_codon:yes stop_codon:yes gene_type:complete